VLEYYYSKDMQHRVNGKRVDARQRRQLVVDARGVQKQAGRGRMGAYRG
jgi:hypothetical protein